MSLYQGLPVLLWCSGILCHMGDGRGMSPRICNPETGSVIPAFWDTLPQGYWGGAGVEVVPGQSQDHQCYLGQSNGGRD